MEYITIMKSILIQVLCFSSYVFVDTLGSKPCLNGGTCFGSPYSEGCSCPFGYSGDDCSIDVCKASPCRNGATLLFHRGTWPCMCLWSYDDNDGYDGYDGDHCSEDKSTTIPTSQQPSSNGGTPGYKDKSTTIPTSQQPSSNGGTPGYKENAKLIVLVAVFGTALLISLIVVTGLVIKLKCHSSPPEAPSTEMMEQQPPTSTEMMEQQPPTSTEMMEQQPPTSTEMMEQPPTPGDGYCIPDNGSYLHPVYLSLK